MEVKILEDGDREEELKKWLRRTLKPKRKVYVKGMRIFISAKDLEGKRWELVKFGLGLTPKEWNGMKIEPYHKAREGMWKVIMWEIGEKGRKKNEEA